VHAVRVVEGRTFTGPAGVAVEVLHEWEPDDPPDVQGTVATWFLRVPEQSPGWDRYLLSVVHLRPIDGVRPAVVRVPHATHEVLLLALDPAVDPQPTDVESWRFLRPVNVCEQIELPHDDAARVLLGLAARAVVAGVLWAEPPLSGQLEPWRTVLIRTSAHLRGEEHAP
jgi:hypothetical protein